jgi:imidazolonepropionase-like amidohydrolase
MHIDIRKYCTAIMLALLASLAIAADEPEAIAFTQVGIVDPATGTERLDQTVIVRGTQIETVGHASAVPVPAGATVIDAKGYYLSPGLVEMHAHVPEARMGREYLEDMLFLWVANGVTTIRNMAGEPEHLELREQIANQQVLGPRMYTSGPRFAGARMENADAMVVAQAAAGYDFVKVHMALSRPIYDDVVAAAAEQQLDVAGHVAVDIGLWRALEARQKSIDHLDAYFAAMVRDDADLSGVKDQLLGLAYMPYVDPDKFAEVARATADAGVWNVPTLTLAVNFIGPYSADAYPELQYMPAKMAKSWVAIVSGFQKTLEDPQQAQQFLADRMKLVKALHDAGAGLLLGSDTPQMMNVPGFSTHKELALMIQSGLTPAEALATGTVNPAIYFSAEDSFGRIEAGLEADMILSAASPLQQPDTLQKPAGVMVRGRWLSGEVIESRLQKLAAKYAQ